MRDASTSVSEELKTLGVCYLNSQYDGRRLDLWKKTRFGEATLYDYVESHLGYRIFLKEVLWDRKAEKLLLTIENTGFGPLLETAEIRVMIQRKMKKDLSLQENIDLTGEDQYTYEDEQRLIHRVHHADWQGGESYTVELPLQELPRGQYIMSVLLRRLKDGRQIYFVNEDPASIERIPMAQA